MSNREIAITILEQMGKHFVLMTGARNFLIVENGIQFDLPRNDKKINKVIIKLNGNDLYDITFYNFRAMNLKVVAQVSDVYNDQLQNTFTEYTGLYTKL